MPSELQVGVLTESFEKHFLVTFILSVMWEAVLPENIMGDERPLEEPGVWKPY